MTYTEEMWRKYTKTVLTMWSQGYMVYEIARVLESSEDLVKEVIERYQPSSTQT